MRSLLDAPSTPCAQRSLPHVPREVRCSPGRSRTDLCRLSKAVTTDTRVYSPKVSFHILSGAVPDPCHRDAGETLRSPSRGEGVSEAGTEPSGAVPAVGRSAPRLLVPQCRQEPG